MGLPVAIEPPVPPAIVVPAEAYAAGRTVSLGLPVGRDQLDGGRLRIRLKDGRTVVDAQTRTLATWPDGDPKWLLASFPAPEAGAGPFTADLLVSRTPADPPPPILAADESGFSVAAGGLVFRVANSQGGGLVESVRAPDGTYLCRSGGSAIDLVAVDDAGAVLRARKDLVWIEENGPHRAVVRVLGRLVRENGDAGDPLLTFFAEIEFEPFRPGPLVRVTLRNDDHARPRNVRYRSCEVVGRFVVGGEGFGVRFPLPNPLSEESADSDTTILQGLSADEVRGATSHRFRRPDRLGTGYSYATESATRAFDPRETPAVHYVIAGNERFEAFASIRHLSSNWGGFRATREGDVVASLFPEAQGPHTMRLGSWETREALFLLAAEKGTIAARAEAFSAEFPRLVRFLDPSAWNLTGAFPRALSPVEERMAVLASIPGSVPRNLARCPEAPYRVRFHEAGTTGGSNQWDAAHDYWFAWASTGDPNAWLIAEAWADYRTDHAVPHAGAARATNAAEFPVTDGSEAFDNAHRHSRYLPIWHRQTGQLRFEIAAHDELSNIFGSDRVTGRYVESRITARLLDLGARFSEFEIDRGLDGGPLLRARIRDYLAYVLSLRWNFESPNGSRGWANEPGRRDRDPRTFWAATPGKGDPLSDVSFMVASILPEALESWVDVLPEGDPLRAESELRIRDLADFVWEYLVSKSDDASRRGMFFKFDTRPGAAPAPGYGEPGYDPNDPPDLYHPIYSAFTSAYRSTGLRDYLDRAAYWAAGQTHRNAPWVTFHRPDFQEFARLYASTIR